MQACFVANDKTSRDDKTYVDNVNKEQQDINLKQNNKRADSSKVESDDSPEVPDRRETSEAPDLPLGLVWRGLGESEGD